MIAAWAKRTLDSVPGERIGRPKKISRKKTRPTPIEMAQWIPLRTGACAGAESSRVSSNMDCSHLLWPTSEASVQARSACAPATALGGLSQLTAGAGCLALQHLGLFDHPASSRPLLKEHDNRAGDEN